MKIKFTLLVFGLVLSNILVTAQTTIKGIVKSEDDKNVSYCSIEMKDSNITTPDGFAVQTNKSPFGKYTESKN